MNICGQCDKKFALLGDLKLHEIVHTEEEPFSFSQCDEKFQQSNQGIHTHEEQFTCWQCEKKFKHFGDSKQHKTCW